MSIFYRTVTLQVQAYIQIKAVYILNQNYRRREMKISNQELILIRFRLILVKYLSITLLININLNNNFIILQQLITATGSFVTLQH